MVVGPTNFLVRNIFSGCGFIRCLAWHRLRSSGNAKVRFRGLRWLRDGGGVLLAVVPSIICYFGGRRSRRYLLSMLISGASCLVLFFEIVVILRDKGPVYPAM